MTLTLALRLEGELVAFAFEGGNVVGKAAALLSASHWSAGICPGLAGQYICPLYCVCPEPVKVGISYHEKCL